MLLVTPGERADVIVTPNGRRAAVAACCMRCSTTAATAASSIGNVEEVLTIAFTDQPPLEKSPCRWSRRAFAAPSIAGATHGRRAARRCRAMGDGKSEFHVNGVPFWKAKPYRRDDRREAGVDREERDQVGAPVSPARLLLPGRSTTSVQPDPSDGVEGHASMCRSKSTVRLLVVFDERPGSGCSTATSSTTPTAG